MGIAVGKPKNKPQGRNPDHWITPPEEIAFVKAVGGGHIDLDPCAGSGPFAPRHAEVNYTERDDGLTSVWFGFVFMNPTYSNLGTWCETAVRWSRESSVVCGLLPAYTGPAWWHDFVGMATAICFLPKRIPFIDPSTGTPMRGSNFDSAYALWGNAPEVHRRFRFHSLKRGAMYCEPRTLREEASRILAQTDLFRRHHEKNEQ